MKSLIIGRGEVGQSLYHVLKTAHSAKIRDKRPLLEEKQGATPRFEVLHICFPYFKGFEEEVKKYQKQYGPKYTIIHSTVPLGTSRKCKSFHSPIRGSHPNLTKSIKTFIKYLAPADMKLKTYFAAANIKVKMFDKQETTELLKILSTTYYAWNIIFCKEVKKICDKHKLDFNEVYTRPNQTYNEGYEILRKTNVRRPILEPMPGPIGGHCLIPNCELLKSKITSLLLKFNKNY